MNLIAAILFDMDGLMLDTEPVAWRGWERALADWGHALPEAIFMQMLGRTAPDVTQFLRETYGPDLPATEVWERKQRYMLEHFEREGLELKPGLLELLAWLDQRAWPKAIATSSDRASARRKLTRAGLWERFNVVVCGDEVSNGKPAPDLFLAAARQLGVSAAHCAVLEDSDAGIAAAHAAGMLPLMVPDLKPPSAQSAALAYRILPSLFAVQSLLQKELA